MSNSSENKNYQDNPDIYCGADITGQHTQTFKGKAGAEPEGGIWGFIPLQFFESENYKKCKENT